MLKPGEMCLVLGCPGAGCSTFLKAIANERVEYARVDGDIRYAGIDAEEMAKTYKGEVVYNQEGEPLYRIATLLLTTNLGKTIYISLPSQLARPLISR